VFLPHLATRVYTNLLDQAGNKIEYGKELGLDLDYEYKFAKDLKWGFAASYFNMSNSLKEMRGFLTFDASNNVTNDESDLQYMVFTILTVNPRLFISN